MLMDQNLLLFLTSKGTFDANLIKLKESVNEYPEFSKFNILFMIYGHDYSQYLILK